MSPSQRAQLQADLDAADRMAGVMAKLADAARASGPTLRTRSCTCAQCATCRNR